MTSGLAQKKDANPVQENKLIFDLRPEWTSVRLGRDFRVTASIISGAILVTRSCGFSNTYDIGRYRRFISKVMAEGLHSGQPYMHVMEWSEFKGGSIGARNQMMKFMQGQTLLKGILVCSSSAFLRMTIRLSEKLYALSHSIKFCSDLDTGVRLAGKRLGISLPNYFVLPPIFLERNNPITQIALQHDHETHELDSIYNHALSDSHTLRIRRIGSGILYCHIQGTSPLPILNVDEINLARQQAVLNCLRAQSVYVEIWDCTNFNQIFRKTMIRQLFRAIFKSQIPLLGCIFLDTGSRISALAHWCLMGNRPPFPVQCLASLTIAILKAQELLREAGYAALPETPQILSLPEWQLRDDECRVDNELIDDDIVHSTVSGYLTNNHIKPAFRIQEKLAYNATSMGRPYYVVVGVSSLHGATYKARKFFITSTLKLFHDVPFRIYIFYGAKGLTLAGINLARHRAPYRVMVADDLQGALSIIRADKLLQAYLSAPQKSVENNLPQHSALTLKHYVDDILHYLSTTSWEFTTKSTSHAHVDPNHPFAPVFDAIDLIKDDLGVLYQEQQKALKEQYKLESQLAQSRKIEALGLLAGGVAHDLNNVLSGMVTYPDVLLEELPPDSSMQEPLMRIRDSGEKAATIVQDLLTLARRGVINAAVENLNTIILEYLESPEHQVLNDRYPEIRVETNLSEELVNITGSTVHLKKTIMNLIYNAFEASYPGRSVTIQTHNRYLDQPVDGYDDISEGHYAVIEIEDHGSGIAPEDLARIFEPFYTKKKMGRSGTGLGMAVVWGTVQDHKGYIAVESTVGRGTRFSLYFPATQRVVEADDRKANDQSLRGNGEHILVVDDVHEQLDIATAVLGHLNYRVAIVDSGEAAVQFVENNRVDLVIIDMVMEQGMDGLDTLRHIRQRIPQLKVIIASGYSETDRLQEALSMTGPYLKKPYTVKTLGVAVKNVLTGEKGLAVEPPPDLWT